jgi:multiple sugar transport system substrate-binding protein
MEEAVSTPKFRGHDAAVLMAENAIQEIYGGKVPLGNGLHRLQKEINAFLQR